MPPLIPKSWITDPGYIELLNYIIKRTENVESPMPIGLLAREFKEKSGTALTAKCIEQRIERVRKIIHSFEHIDTKTKVKLLFALSASVNAGFLNELEQDAFVEIDDKQRIIDYKANDGNLEFRGDHSLSAKMKTGKLESKGSFRSIIINYFENKNDADRVPMNKREEEMWNFIEFITAKCENVTSPLSITRLAKDVVEFRTSMPSETVRSRIERYGLEIQSMEFVDTPSKVQQLFGLSATVNSDCLEKLRKNAVVEVDEKNRIVFYKADDGSIELRGDHSQSAKTKIAILESKRSLRSLINSYFENKNNADAVPKTEIEKEIGNLIKFITEKCEQVDHPLSIHQFAKDFNRHVGLAQSLDCIHKRIEAYCREIQTLEFLDTHTKVKHLFSLSAKVSSNCLEKLRKDAHVEVDKKNRISYYKAKNGGLELAGDHSRSAKNKITQFDTKRSIRSWIIDYFENKDNADSVPENDEEKEMWNLIEFITDMCENVDTPLNIFQLTKDFNKLFELSRSLDCIKKRIRGYCHEIQEAEFLDTPSKVKQLFGLSAKLNSDCLKELRKNDLVEVDHENRIIKYTANDGSLTVRGSHCRTKKTSSRRVEKKNKNIAAAMSDNSEEESDGLDDSSDEYSSEEFGSEFDSDDDNDSQDEPEDLVGRSNKADYFDNESSMRNNSTSEMSIDDEFGFNPLAEKSQRSEETEMRKDEENDPGNSENAVIMTRSGRLSKKRHLDSEFSYNLANCGSSGTMMSTNPASWKPTKQKKIAIEKEESARSTREKSSENMENQAAPRAEDNPSDYREPRIQEIEDNDYNPREDNTHESSPINNRIQESESSVAKEHNKNIKTQNTDNRADVDAPEPKPEKESLTPQNVTNSTPPTNAKEVNSQDAPIKVENEEPVGNPSKDVKPETTHNFKIKFFNAMKSLILSLNTPFLSNLQSNIKQKIRKIGRSGEMISNDEMILSLELLVARMNNHSVIDISEGVESVSLIQFFCYLKASILNSKMLGVESLVENISKRIEESQNKRIPMGKVANALRATLDIVDGF